MQKEMFRRPVLKKRNGVDRNGKKFDLGHIPKASHAITLPTDPLMMSTDGVIKDFKNKSVVLSL